jgi:hypothetical protein
MDIETIVGIVGMTLGTTDMEDLRLEVTDMEVLAPMRIMDNHRRHRITG